jgi:hypothetical protein
MTQGRRTSEVESALNTLGLFNGPDVLHIFWPYAGVRRVKRPTIVPKVAMAH